MRILGIDPGFERLGIAILDKKNNQKENLVFSECFKTDKKLKLNKRIFLMFTRFKNEVLSISNIPHIKTFKKIGNPVERIQ